MRKRIITILQIIFTITLLIGGYFILSSKMEHKKAVSKVENIKKELVQERPIISKKKVDVKVKEKEYNIVEPNFDINIITKDRYNELQNINSDIIGYLHFDTGIISEPVLYSGDNDFYLYRDIYKEYDKFGSIFMDKNTSLSDTNISLYGHASTYYTDVKFQPLNTMYRDYDMLNDNKFFSLYTNNEIRRYKISYLYDYNEFAEFNHTQQNFQSEEDFNRFISWIASRSYFTGEHIYYGDNFISLQVCLSWNQDRRLIVVAKEIDVLDFN